MPWALPNQATDLNEVAIHFSQQNVATNTGFEVVKTALVKQIDTISKHRNCTIMIVSSSKTKYLVTLKKNLPYDWNVKLLDDWLETMI